MIFKKDIRWREKKPTVKQLDNLCRDIIRVRDKMTCQRCGRQMAQGWQMHWSHFYSRSIKATRWDCDNSKILCAGCHFWAHKNPREFTEFWTKELGEQKMNDLTLRRNCTQVDRFLVEIYLNQQKKEIYENKKIPKVSSKNTSNP